MSFCKTDNIHDGLNTVETTLLPRTMAEGAVVPVDFKRMKAMKNIHRSGCVRPIKMIKVLAYLKDCKNEVLDSIIIIKNFKTSDRKMHQVCERCCITSESCH